MSSQREDEGGTYWTSSNTDPKDSQDAKIHSSDLNGKGEGRLLV